MFGKRAASHICSIASELRIRATERPDLLPLFQDVLINNPSPQRAGLLPVKEFIGLHATTPIATLYRSPVSAPILVPDVDRKRVLNCEQLCRMVANIRPVVRNALLDNLEHQRNQAAKGHPPNFTEGDFVLIAREDFAAGEKLLLHWRGPKRVLGSVNDYIYQVENLHNEAVEDVLSPPLKFFHDP